MHKYTKVYVLVMGDDPREYFVDRQKALDEVYERCGKSNSEIYIVDVPAKGTIMQHHVGFDRPHRRGRMWEAELKDIINF